MFIFSTFWPILKVLQILGLFPIKKSSENVCGFQAMPTVKYLVLTVAVQSLGYASYIIPLFVIMSKHNLGFLEILHINFALNGSPLDDITYFGIMISTGILVTRVLIEIFPLKSQIIQLLELFQRISMQHVTIQETRKSKIMLLLIAIAWLLFPIFVTVTILWRLIDHINIDISTALMFGILNCIFTTIWMVAPVCSFLMLFSEPCYQLNAWMKCLIQLVESKEQSDQKIVYECKKFYYKGNQIKLIRLAHIPHLIIMAHLTIEPFFIKV